MSVSPITTHILDTARGCPAAGLALRIEIEREGKFEILAEAVSNEDGRVASLLPHDKVLARGRYRMRFETGPYFSKLGISGFYPYVEVVFEINEPAQHYHIPLLLSPFGYSTYRGS